jgi:hypothetical protein
LGEYEFLSRTTPVMDKYQEYMKDGFSDVHAAGTFSNAVLKQIESILPTKVKNTAETGCGKSTILLSNISENHTIFAIDDSISNSLNSSIDFFKKHPLTKNDRIKIVLGPTQITLPAYKNFHDYDVVLLDGPHGYPFPELEYYYFYPHVKIGGILIIDDIHIPSVGRMADFIAEDVMFNLIKVVGTTAIFKRTDIETFDPFQDGWWTQRYNQRRVSPESPFFLNDGAILDVITSMGLKV